MSGKVEWHYAPMTGGLAKKVDGVAVQCDNWLQFNNMFVDFLDQRKSGVITLKQTINYGHELFNGHQGRVDIYS